MYLKIYSPHPLCVDTSLLNSFQEYHILNRITKYHWCLFYMFPFCRYILWCSAIVNSLRFCAVYKCWNENNTKAGCAATLSGNIALIFLANNSSLSFHCISVPSFRTKQQKPNYKTTRENEPKPGTDNM